MYHYDVIKFDHGLHILYIEMFEYRLLLLYTERNRDCTLNFIRHTVINIEHACSIQKETSFNEKANIEITM